MGRQKGKRQVVVYLRPELHEGLRLQAARSGGTISGLVEEAVRVQLSGPGPRLQIPLGIEEATSPALEALAHFGAPLWSRGAPGALGLEAAVAEALVLSRSHPSLLRVLPVVLFKNRRRLRWRALRSQVPRSEQAALGMLLELTLELTGVELFRRWADELRRHGVLQDPPAFFFVNGPRGRRYEELAEQRTPAAARRWGFLMATPIEDFLEAMRRHCPDSPSSTART